MNTLSCALSLTTGSFTGPMRGAQEAMKGFTSSLSQVGNIVTGLASIPGAINTLVAPLSKPITLAADMESLNAELGILVGSTKLAGDLIKDIKSFADVTPFNTQGLVENAKMLLGFGASTKSLMPSLKMIGDVAGSSSERMERLTLAYAQITASGKLMGQDFLQLVNAGFNPLQEMSRTTGQSMNALREKMEKGAISADMVAEAFRTATSAGGRFFGNTIAQGNAFHGKMSTLGDAWANLNRAFGGPVMLAMKPIIEEVTGRLNEWQPIAKNFGETLATGISGAFNLLKSGELGGVMESAVAGLGQLLMSNISISLRAGIRAGAEVLSGVFQSVVALFSDSNFWDGIRNSALSIAYAVKSIILDVAADLISMLPGKNGIAAEWKKTARSTQGLADAYQQQAGVNFEMVDFEKVVKPLVDSAGKAGNILADAITTVAENIKNNPSLASAGEALSKAAASGKMNSIAEMANASRRLVGSEMTKKTFPIPYGEMTKLITTPKLNPEIMEKLMNPRGQSESGNALAFKKAIDNASPLKNLLNVAQRILDAIPTLQTGTFPMP